jgi:mannose-1-phosphate guanylyltransferase
MQAVVLVGGEGTRLRPLTYALPKQMLPVAGITMLERALMHLADHGVTEAVLSLGYKPDVFLKAFPDGTAAGIKLRYAVENTPLDTAGAIAFAAREAGIADTFIVINGDVLTDNDITKLVEVHNTVGAEGTISLTPVDDPSRYGVVPTHADGRVKEFIEKPPRESAPTNLINAGTYVLEPTFLDRIKVGEKVSIERVVFPAMVADDVLYAVADDSYWVDAGTPATYRQVNLDLVAGERSTAPMPNATKVGAQWLGHGATATEAKLNGDVLVCEGAAAHDTAQLSAVVLHSNSRVGPNAIVENSVLLEGAVVEANAVVRDSCVAGTVGEGATVESESVIGADFTVEAGAQLREARLPA